jgi:hypothetical protein
VINMRRLVLAGLPLVVLPLGVPVSHAQPVPNVPPPPTVQAPPPPPPVESGEPLEPQVRILETPRETIYEYRRNGRLVLVRVQPRFGPPYHFIDFDGDGSLDYRPGEPVHDNINQWILLTW